MKKLIVILTLLGISLSGYAQDVITKRNGDIIQARVLEITLDAVKYKRFDNLEGPVIYLAKSDIFVITYENGTKETFTEYAKPSTPPSTPYAQPRQAPVVKTPAHDPVYDPGQNLVPVQQPLKLSGPRVGFTLLSPKYVSHIDNRHDIKLNPFLTQFGWQFETRMFTLDNGLSGLIEFVPLIGGLEQGRFLPSINALIGIRGPKGFEFGVGPNLTLSGTALVLAAGTNIHMQGVNFPINLAYVPSKDGSRISILFGFNSNK